MIDYEVLCQTIEDWRAGRRPSIDLSATPVDAVDIEPDDAGYEQAPVAYDEEVGDYAEPAAGLEPVHHDAPVQQPQAADSGQYVEQGYEQQQGYTDENGNYVDPNQQAYEQQQYADPNQQAYEQQQYADPNQQAYEQQAYEQQAPAEGYEQHVDDSATQAYMPYDGTGGPEQAAEQIYAESGPTPTPQVEADPTPEEPQG